MTDQRMKEQPSKQDTGPTASPPPRAFAQGTGIVMQMVGGVLFLSSCCVCSAAFLWDPPLTTPQAKQIAEKGEIPRNSLEHLLDEPDRLGMMLMVIVAPVGGLSLMVFGLGLQSQKPLSGWGAIITNAALLVVLIVAGIALWTGGASFAALLWHAIMSMVVAVLIGFAFVALRQMRADPPSGALHLVPHDYDPKKGL